MPGQIWFCRYDKTGTHYYDEHGRLMTSHNNCLNKNDVCFVINIRSYHSLGGKIATVLVNGKICDVNVSFLSLRPA